jgi:hypothetical protein
VIGGTRRWRTAINLEGDDRVVIGDDSPTYNRHLSGSVLGYPIELPPGAQTPAASSSRWSRHANSRHLRSPARRAAVEVQDAAGDIERAARFWLPPITTGSVTFSVAR